MSSVTEASTSTLGKQGEMLFAPRPSAGPCVPSSVERAIAVRWRQWIPWVRMHLLRARQSDPTVNAAIESPESCRMRERHTEHILAMMREGVSMRTIRRHRLDDPRLKDEVRAVLVDAAKARQSKAWFRRSEEQRREDMLRTLIRLSQVDGRDSMIAPDSASPEGDNQPASIVPDRLSVPGAIESIRRQVCEQFYLREMRDPELTVRTNRRS
jgi:hypothetical protein